eukprot:2159578-Prymnesium_polylepis.1
MLVAKAHSRSVRLAPVPTARRAMSAYKGRTKLTPREQGVSPVGSGVPVGTPRDNWDAYGYATRCASYGARTRTVELARGRVQ